MPPATVARFQALVKREVASQSSAKGYQGCTQAEQRLAKLVIKGLRKLRAPSKRVCWFERSAHSPHKEEPAAFTALLFHALLGEGEPPYAVVAVR